MFLIHGSTDLSNWSLYFTTNLGQAIEQLQVLREAFGVPIETDTLETAKIA